MPPRICIRVPVGSLQQQHAVNSTICARPFSSTPSTLALGPESPNYIEVPKPKQPSYDHKPRMKGVLPTPRDIFRIRNAKPKESEELIKQSTPDATKVKIPGPFSKDAEYRLYKQRLAASRKQALKEGIQELHVRKTTTEASESSRIKALQADKLARAMAPPRDVDVLTQNSVSKSIRDFLHDELPSSSRSNISDDRRVLFRRKMAKHEAKRQARLHDLYTNAREFIVTESQLDEAIEKEFGTEEEPMGWDNMGKMVQGAEGRSPWNGPIPEGISDMLQKLKGGEGVGLAKERVKKVAEELTGGKM
ncbi:hypothetical protein BU24DRAFT_418009 [Aaosphaeria arxii CBS 175.79]|uniref:Uncharacterized protein n=1 Tax=Aaosphaeria arxii CBS 175.79 TaxID=1450172 RepID=A0A6A5YAU9_9PLEO|nr:uncharacterized protein BU24DRAFT_418009 [Aaosphaeria arxii CBS 175.79]KAF2022366.1 hypothetical protein BU24DRAFT_418009 [Aaosphaeria arxii CBS 175.79]